MTYLNKMKNINRNKRLLMTIIIICWLIMISAQWNVFPLSQYSDLNRFQLQWWEYLRSHGFTGIATINHDINGNYGPVWYFMIVIFNKIGLYPALSVAHCIKLMTSILALGCGLISMKIVSHTMNANKYNDIIAFVTVMFGPALFGDLFKTNLPDSFYYLFVLLAILSVVKKQDWLSWFFIGISISFKAMGIYILPAVFFLYLTSFKRLRLINKLAPTFTILGMFICSIPGIVAGMTPINAMLGNIISRGSKVLSLKFGFWRIFDGGSWIWWPTLSNSQQQQMYIFGLMLLISVFLGLYSLVFFTENSSDEYLNLWYLLVVSPLLFWFFLPAQHETYFSLSPLLGSLLFAQYPSKKNFTILIIANFFVWEGYHGFQQLTSPITYCYLILVFILYIIYTMFGNSNIKRFFDSKANFE